MKLIGKERKNRNFIAEDPAEEETGQDLSMNQTYPAESRINGMVNTGVMRLYPPNHLDFHSLRQQACEWVLDVYILSGLPMNRLHWLWCRSRA